MPRNFMFSLYLACLFFESMRKTIHTSSILDNRWITHDTTRYFIDTSDEARESIIEHISIA